MAQPADRIDELVDLTNRVFRSNGGDMGREYPLVFDPGNPEGMRVVLEEGKIVSHVGVCIRDAALLGVPLRVASIGAVCTDPNFRGRGFAGSLMEDAIAYARSKDAHVMLISGDRSLYRRLGGLRAGTFHFTEAAHEELPQGLALDEAGEDDIPDLAALYSREPVRFVRPAEDWKRLLEAGMLMNRAATCWLVRDSERALAYVAVQTPTSRSSGDDRPNVMEYAGSREAAWTGMKALAGRYGSASVRISLMPDDLDLLGRANREGLPVHQSGFHGTVRLLNVAETLDRVKTLWIERAGQSTVDALEWEADAEGLSYASDEGRVRLEGAEATAAIFGPERSQENPPAIPGMEPLPLFWYGYNYV
jgi:predicted N-acetyltransferase YhbS